MNPEMEWETPNTPFFQGAQKQSHGLLLRSEVGLGSAETLSLPTSSSVSVAMVKQFDRKQTREERAYVILYLQVTAVCH